MSSYVRDASINCALFFFLSFSLELAVFIHICFPSVSTVLSAEVLGRVQDFGSLAPHSVMKS